MITNPSSIVFSLLVPIKNNTEKLSDFLNSIEKTSIIPQKIEICIAYDDDNNETEKFLIYLRPYTFNIRLFKRPRSPHLRQDYDVMAQNAYGKYIWALNDDVVFLTPSWDQMLLSCAEKFLTDKKDRICYIGVFDNADNSPERLKGYSCFPVLTREFMTIIGSFLFESTPDSEGDKGVTWSLFKKIPYRVLNASQIVLKSTKPARQIVQNSSDINNIVQNTFKIVKLVIESNLPRRQQGNLPRIHVKHRQRFINRRLPHR